jgi:hypothetical protein
MATLGSNLDKVKIIKQNNSIIIIETFSNQQYSGLGRGEYASLSAEESITVHNIQNIVISIKNETVVIKSAMGVMHTFNINIVETEGFKFKTELEFIQNLIK